MKYVADKDWSDDYEEREARDNARIRRQQKIDAKKIIRDKKRSGTYYELPQWQREKLEDD
jgi:hypothetical protein